MHKHILGVGLSIALLLPASAQTVGGWTIKQSRSELDGAAQYSASLSSTNTITDAIGVAAKATLIIRCRNRELSAYVAWPAYMGLHQKTVLWKFDNGTVWKADWDLSTDGTATFSNNVLDFLTDLARSTRLVVSAKPYDRESAEAVFDLGDASTVVVTAQSLCRR